MALLWSARPDLVRNIAATKQVLTGSANPAVGNGGSGCGGSSTVPNNHFGWGLVDAAAAYNGSNHVLAVSKNGTGTGSVTSTPTGVTCGTVCSASYPAGDPVTLTATASAGSTFTGWSGDCTGTGTCTVTMDGDHSVTANFQLVRPTLTVTTRRNRNGQGHVEPGGDQLRHDLQRDVPARRFRDRRRRARPQARGSPAGPATAPARRPTAS